jgi:hypothetical protein
MAKRREVGQIKRLICELAVVVCWVSGAVDDHLAPAYISTCTSTTPVSSVS